MPVHHIAAIKAKRFLPKGDGVNIFDESGLK
jgi:hypothetical protein